MNKMNWITSMAMVSAMFSMATSLPIEKSGACPTFTRTSTWNGQAVSFSSFPVKADTSYSNHGQLQNPLPPELSINCIQVPPGLKVQLMASEVMTTGTN